MQKPSKLPILCLDFDGVLHSYESGWQGADVIPDPPVSGAIEFLMEAIHHFEVHIFSSRSNQSGGIVAMAAWLVKNGVPYNYIEPHDMDWRFHRSSRWGVSETRFNNPIKLPTVKPAAMVSIDDRAITFTGTWPDMASLLAFRPWNKQ